MITKLEPLFSKEVDSLKDIKADVCKTLRFTLIKMAKHCGLRIYINSKLKEVSIYADNVTVTPPSGLSKDSVILDEVELTEYVTDVLDSNELKSDYELEDGRKVSFPLYVCYTIDELKNVLESSKILNSYVLTPSTDPFYLFYLLGDICITKTGTIRY